MVPGGQGEQLLECLAPLVPEGQTIHESDPPMEYVLTLHCDEQIE